MAAEVTQVQLPCGSTVGSFDHEEAWSIAHLHIKVCEACITKRQKNSE